MKKVILPFLGMLILGLSSCKKEADDIVYGSNVAAILGIDGQPVLITHDEILYAPDLSDFLYYNGIYLYEDDPVLASFALNRSRQPAGAKYRTVSIVDIIPLGLASAVEEDRGDKGTLVPIDSMFCFNVILHDRNNVLFAGFYHNSYYRFFDYEITYEVGEADEEVTGQEFPVLSIRAKPLESSKKNTLAIYRYPYAFDLYEYFHEILAPNAENKVTFGIRFSKGVDKDGVEDWDYLKEKNGDIGKFIIPLESPE